MFYYAVRHYYRELDSGSQSGHLHFFRLTSEKGINRLTNPQQIPALIDAKDLMMLFLSAAVCTENNVCFFFWRGTESWPIKRQGQLAPGQYLEPLMAHSKTNYFP